jgi:Na+/melibiose symporter-like transporter
LGGTAAQQSRVLAWREGAGLWGVVLAAMLPLWLGWTLNALVLGVLLLLGVISWRFAWTHHSTATTARGSKASETTTDAQAHQVFGLFEPFQKKQFSKLLLIFVVNGIASAVPASLVLFFVEDQIRVSASHVPLFLGAYFLSGALSLPLWLMAIKRFDLPRAWLFGMVLAVLSFMGVSQLGAGDEWAYFAICVASGTALGADLVVPGAILNGLIDRWGQRGRAEGVYLGWWNLASKFNLALAAGLSLPLLSWWGYSPGTQDANGLQALSAAYGLFPCALKLLAALLLFLFWRTSAKADASNFSNASNRSLS